MDRIGIIGAGQMGSGIAQAVAAAGKRVLVADIDLATAEAAKAKIGKGLDRLVAKEKIAADDDADVQALKGWRREVFGEDALRLKRGELALSIKKRKVVLTETRARSKQPAE